MNPAAVLSPSGVSQLIPLASIPTHEASQVRIKIRPAVVRAYAQAMRQQVREGGLRFPVIVLFSDGQRHWLADGFHRVMAAREAGLTDFPAEVRSGNERDALLCSIAANAGHGLPRSNADKRKAVSLLLADPEWSRWSDGAIARHCQVSQVFVSKIRKSASHNGYEMKPRKVRRGAAVYEMQPRTINGEEMVAEGSAETPGVAAPACDRIGMPLAPDVVGAFAFAGDFAAAQGLLDQLAALVDRLAQGAGGAAYRQHLLSRAGDGRVTFYSPELNFFGQKLVSSAPHCGACPRCLGMHAGRIQPCCKMCGGRGWLTKTEYDRCTQQERQELERLRKNKYE
jgi:hypothetical protein